MKQLVKGLSRLINMAKNHGGYFVTTFINSSLPLLFLPVLTRYLEPAEYANIALFNFYLALSNSLSGTSVPVVISKNFFEKPKEYIAKIIGNSIRIVFMFSSITTILILIFYKQIESFLDLPLLWLLLIPWGSFFFILFNMALTVHRNEKKVLVFSYHKIGNTFVNILISLFLIVVLLWGWQGRVVGILASYFISAIWALYYLKKQHYLKLSFNKDLTKDILKVILPLVPNSFQYIIISHVGLFFMQLYFAKDVVGVYSVSYQISFSISLLYTTLSFSWNPYVYEQLSRKGKINAIEFTRYFYLLSAVVFSGVVFLYLFSGFILKVLTTNEYMGATVFIPLLSLGFFFKGMYVLLLPILMKHEMQKNVSLISLVNMFLMLGLNIVFIKLYGPIGVTYAFCATCFLLFLPVIILVQKVNPLPWLKALTFLKK
ncbi:oligosaccharide flippase family protein [Marinifilum fragile]|uniref:oligosaccharide flippase family protein n=1 Tax=Marinifilum fragile TaxID=570161 RepID=UPI002AA72CEF|nr:oligosaccharide flippase family protein [Marinifilum fragile]